MNRITFQPTEEDLISAYRLHFWDSLKRRRAWLRFLLVGAVFALGAAFLMGSDVGVVTAGLTGAIYWFALLGIILLINFLLLPRRGRRIFRQQKSLHHEADVEWSEEGISFRSDQANATFRWSDFLRLIDGRTMILLMQSDALFNFLPKASLSPEQTASILAHKKP